MENQIGNVGTNCQMSLKTSLYQYIPGYLQGFVKITLSYPFDTIKVQMQKGLYPTMKATFFDLLKNDPKKFYRGSTLPYIIIPIERAIYYRYAERLNAKYNGFISGGLMGALSTLYYVPLQYVTTNAVLIKKQNYQNIYGLIRSTPIADLYKGFNVELVRSSLATSIFLGTYMHIRDSLKDQKISTTISPLSGPFASIVSWLVVFPLDTLRTEKQTSDKTITAIIKDKYRNSGVRSFYRGLTPIVIRTVPSTSIGMYLYEYSRCWCSRTTN